MALVFVIPSVIFEIRSQLIHKWTEMQFLLPINEMDASRRSKGSSRSCEAGS